MDILIYSDQDTWIHRLDPRTRILAACAISIVLATSHAWASLLFGLLLGCLAVTLARVPVAALLQRLVPLNGVLFLVLAALLFFTPGDMLFQIGPVQATREGLREGAAIWLKSNAIVLTLAALLGTLELVALGHALTRLRVPPMLTHILLFTVRYMGLMLSEYERLSRAARIRGYAPGFNQHTLRTTGYLVGMILVRSYARGERIRDAMRLRGYQGEITFVGELVFRRGDALFAGLAAVAVALLAGLEWQ